MLRLDPSLIIINYLGEMKIPDSHSIKDGKKRCQTCGKNKPLSEWSIMKATKRPRSHCKKCAAEKACAWQKANRMRITKRNQAARHKNLDKARAIKRKHRYGITAEQYEAMLNAQGNKCAICQGPPKSRSGVKSLHVDHCHGSKKVRGLLCFTCNSGIGMLQDDPKIIEAALKYLLKHATN